MASFNFIELLPGVDHSNFHVATAGIAVGAMVLIAIAARAALGTGESAVVPASKFSLKGFFEQLTEFVSDLAVSVIGPEGRKFVPMFTTIFFFIFFNNIIGLLPGMAPATENMNTGVAVGLFVFIVYNAYGLAVNGWAYLKHFTGPIALLAPFMVLVELISHVVRPISLGLRLKANMTADHMLLGIFTDITHYVIPVAFYFLGLFVCGMQAFIFTILTMIYISMSISHDH